MKYSYTQNCPVLFGEGTSKNVGAELKKLGCKRVLIVCDKNGVKFGLIDGVRKGLDAASLETFVFDEVMPDPTDIILDKGANIARELHIDGVVGVGGGSVLDTAKAISVLLTNNGSVRDHMKPNIPPNAGRPLILLPTTAGTGSEITDVGVITDTNSGIKLGVVCKANLAIIDPELTYSMPSSITAETAMDAFAHAAECMTGTLANPHADLLAEEAIRLIYCNLPKAVEDGKNKEARSALSLASNLAGIAFSESFVHVGHAMAHAMGMKLHLSHGAGCALALPCALSFVAEEMHEKLTGIGKAMGMSFTGEEAPKEIGQLVAGELRSFMHKVGVASLSQRGVTQQQLDECPPYAIQDFLVDFCPRKVTEDELKKMYKEAIEDY